MATGRQFDFLLVGLRDPATDQVLAGGTVETYTATGTFAAPKKAYTTYDTTGADHGASILLDAYGRAQAWGDGQYDMIVKNAAGTVIYTLIGYDGYNSQQSLSLKLNSASPTLTSGNLAMSGGKITGVAAGVASDDVARVDQLIANSGNLIINGDMLIAQRGASIVSPSSSDYLLDRWDIGFAGAVACTVSQSAGAPSAAQSGRYINTSLKVDITTADNAIAAGDFLAISQQIEGYRFRPIYQQTFTLSFWVNSKVTGTYCVSFRNSGNDRSYVSEYTINVADTWEKKTITVSAVPSGGTWNLTTGRGIAVTFTMSCGSTFHTTAGAWQTGNYYATSNQVNLSASTDNEMFITGIELAPVASAASIIPRDFAEELALCQRYYYRLSTTDNATGDIRFGFGYCPATTVGRIMLEFPVTMRATPTLNVGTDSLYSVFTTAATVACTNVAISLASTKNAVIDGTVAAGLTGEAPAFLINSVASNGAALAFIAEI